MEEKNNLLEKYEKLEKEKENKQQRMMPVVKHNSIIQDTRITLSLVEQKTVNFLVSLIPPRLDLEEEKQIEQPREYEFNIQQYCKVCGINSESGNNYRIVRNTLKALRDKSVIVKLPDGRETAVSWINKFWCEKGSGYAKIRFDDDMASYIFDLRDNRTQFELMNVLPMKSKYSVRMYELCRSYAYRGGHVFTVEEMRKLMGVSADELVRFPDFKRYVLMPAQKEINQYTDLNIAYYFSSPVGKKVEKIRIDITKKSEYEKDNTLYEDGKILDSNL